MIGSSLQTPIAATLPTLPCRVLIVDDDPVVRVLLRDLLNAADYHVAEADSAKAAERYIYDESWDLVLLDRRLPDSDGLLLLQMVKAHCDCPVIVLTVLDEEHDRLLGLGLGAADYVCKPFSVVEICSRIRRVLKLRPDAVQATTIHRGPFRVCTRTRRLIACDKTHHLTPAETRLIALFMSHPGAVLGREELTRQVCRRAWSYNDRSVDVLVARLRRRIEINPRRPEWIVTVHGEGYVFDQSVV